MAKRQDDTAQKGSQKSTLTERTYEAIKKGILQGAFPEGSFLTEVDIARRYGFGRTPFREACNRLHREHLLQVVPRRGYLVPEMSFRTVRDLFETRLIVEGALAELAAARATREEVDQLFELASRPVNRSSPAGSQPGPIEVNREFHLLLARMAQNQELLIILTSVLERTERISCLEFRYAPFGDIDLAANHLPIAEAIRKGDQNAARSAMIDDIIKGQLNTYGRELWGADRKATLVPFPSKRKVESGD